MTITNSLATSPSPSSSMSSSSSSTSSYDSSSTASSSSSNLIYQQQQQTAANASLTSNLDSLNSYQNRNQNALQRRAQQLRRWREIEELEQKEQQQQPAPKSRTPTKVCFSPVTLFLSACAQRDFEECERLLTLKELQDAGGVDVTNCDGLTALHQACIDDNEPMVRWLLAKSANINCKDNEGWTPLHAAANCGNHNIVKILISHPGCDLFALNCDNELAIDVCETKECEDLIRQQMDKVLNYSESNNSVGWNSSKNKRKFRGSFDDEDAAGGGDEDDEFEELFKNLRQQELKAIEEDIAKWIETANSIDIRAEIERTRDPLSGATILHVCAAKGYNDALELFLSKFSNRLDLDSFRDCDGYTALHAAAFWRQPETFETLLRYGANPDLLTAKTSDNIISSSVLELCKNDPKFIELIEINKEKEKIAKESETQRKIFAKRQRETRRSTQGVRKEDLEQAIKMMEISTQNDSPNDKLETNRNHDLNAINNNVAPAANDTSTSDIMMMKKPVEENDSIRVTSAGLPMPPLPKKPPPDSSDGLKTAPAVAAECDNSVIDKPLPANDLVPPETPPTVTMKISSTTPAEFARKRRIKRRSTGIEDDSGHALSPDTLADSVGHPLAGAETIDAAFDVILSTPVNQSRSSRTSAPRPVSNASSLSSLNSLRSSRDTNDNASVTSSRTTSLASLGGDDYKTAGSEKSADTKSISSVENDILLKEAGGCSSNSSGIPTDEIDYKKLCKQLLRENETLRRRIKELEESEKKRDQEFNREKRAMQRTIGELEEELKIMNDIKADNLRLKDENAALIRVISKLSKN